MLSFLCLFAQTVVFLVFVFAIFALCIYVLTKIECIRDGKKKSQQRQYERRKEIAAHEERCQYKLLQNIWELEKKKTDRQTVIIKGCLAEAAAEQLKQGADLL